jgi:hypothetical protein
MALAVHGVHPVLSLYYATHGQWHGSILSRRLSTVAACPHVLQALTVPLTSMSCRP